MRYSTTIAAAGILALGGFATAALAQDDAALTTDHLAAIDTDGDGTVSQDEFLAYLGRIHTALDADADGFVSWAEAEGRILREHFDAIDTNGDGRVSKAELEAQGRADYASADRDGDGGLK